MSKILNEKNLYDFAKIGMVGIPDIDDHSDQGIWWNELWHVISNNVAFWQV